MTNYKEVFKAVEDSVFGASSLRSEKLRDRLARFKTIGNIQDRVIEFKAKYEQKVITGDQITTDDVNNYYYWVMVYVIFYAGFRSETIAGKLPTIYRHFPHYKTVQAYQIQDINNAMTDGEMVKNIGKIWACYENAKIIDNIIKKHNGSFQSYLDSLQFDTPRNINRAVQELKKFRRFKKITPYHFLTDLGKPVLKPDRVILRTFHRLGLLDSEEESKRNIYKAIMEGQKFADATGNPIRYIDIIFVTHGQVKNTQFEIGSGICLKKPRCSSCQARSYCSYNQS